MVLETVSVVASMMANWLLVRAIHTRSPSGETASWSGEPARGIVAITELVATSMTETERLPKLVTKARLSSGRMPTSLGSEPTGMLMTALVLVVMALTVSNPEFATNTLAPSEVIATPVGCDWTVTLPTAVLVAPSTIATADPLLTVV